MSLSSLGAQLAAISGRSGKHPGSSLPTSKLHEDAVGRGLHYSVQHGHAVTKQGQQASILYQTAREAADVPLQVLEEQCQTALNALSELDEVQVPASVLSICASATTPASSKVLRTALVWISSLLGGKTASDQVIQQYSLHILEYLVRRYRIYERQVEDWIWTFLPHAQELPALVHRALQLVDLTSNQSCLWLRPYAASSPTTIPRPLVARQVIQKSDLVETACAWAQASAQLHDDDDASPKNRGISHTLSWTAALLVEGLAWLTTTDRLPVEEEQTLRTFLPYCLEACGGTTAACPDWTAWGHVVASVLAETMPLAPATTNLLVTRILEGCHDDDGISLERPTDAFVAALSVLLPPHVTPPATQDGDSSFYLPLLNEKWLLGCPLNETSWQALEQCQHLAGILGHLHDDRRIFCAPLVASVIVGALHGMEHHETTLITDLIQEPKLQSLWHDVRLDLVASLAAHVVDHALRNPELLADHGSILQALHRNDAPNCERGIAHAIQSMDDVSGYKPQLAELLQGILAATLEELVSKDDDDDDDRAALKLLPPRVALEHADASVRLQAVHQLVSTLERDDDEEEASDDESLVESLLRRWSMEEDREVALAASTAVYNASLVVTDGNYLRIANLTLSGLYRWIQDTPLDDGYDLMEKSLLIAATVARELGRFSTEKAKRLWQLLVETIVAQLDRGDDEDVERAAKALLVVFDPIPASKKKKSNSVVSIAKMHLASCEPLLRGVQELYNETKAGDNPMETATRRRCLWVLLEAMADHFDGLQPSGRDLIAYCLLLLGSKESANLIDRDKYELLKTCLEKGVSKLAQSGDDFPSVVASLASVPSDKVYTKVALPVIRQLADDVRDLKGVAVFPVAVLMEVALRPDTPSVSVHRLVSLATDCVSKSTDGEPVWLAVVPALALLEVSDDRVRTAAVDLLECIGSRLSASGHFKALCDICRQVSERKSSATMGGNSFLSSLLSATISECRDAIGLRENLLTLCVFSTMSYGGDSIEADLELFRNGWVQLYQSCGGCRAASIVLHAVELTGEDSFPLSLRWKIAGKVILKAIIESDPMDIDIVLPILSVMEAVVRMLKGVMVSDPRIVISSGPGSRGGRSRSYSVGNSDGVAVIDAYPKDMSESLVKVLRLENDTWGARRLASLVARDVLSSKSWGDGVYKKLSRPTRKQMAIAILSFISRDLMDMPEGMFVALPFDSVDVADVLTHAKENRDLVSLSLVTDFIRSNCEGLLDSTGSQRIATLLFDLLKSLSSDEREDVDGLDFALHSVLHALTKIWQGVDGENVKVKVEKKRLSEWVDLLLALLGSSEERFVSVKPLVSYRTRSATLSVLARLCENYPERVVASLPSAILTCVLSSNENTWFAMNANDTLMKLVPVFCAHASLADLSLSDLLSAFVGAVREIPTDERKTILFHALVDALLVENDSSVGAVVAVFLANGVSASTDEDAVEYDVNLAVQILSHASASTQAASLLLLLWYAKGFLLSLRGEEVTDALNSSLFPTYNDVAAIAANGPSLGPCGRKRKQSQSPSKEKITVLTKAVLSTFGDALLLDSIRRFVRTSEGSASSLCLRLWQDLLVVQSSAQSISNEDANKDDDTELWKAVADAVNKSREYLQELLPAHIFLASVTSLITDGGTDEIRSRALRLVADRATELDRDAPEASLFIDLVPVIMGILEPSKDSIEEQESKGLGLVLQQSALIAVEHITRTLGPAAPVSDHRSHTTGSGHFSMALERSATLLLQHYEHVQGSASVFTALDSGERQLVCSIALCTATLIRATGPRCLPILPEVMKTFIDLLASANEYVASHSGDDEGNESLSQARVTQLSMLRVLLAVSESLPQFLGSYLHLLLTESSILSRSLRDGDSVLKASTERLCLTLSTRVPSRLFLPAASLAMHKCSAPDESCSLLAMLKVSVDSASTAEAGAQKTAVLKSVTKAYDFDGTFEYRSMLIEAANLLLLALILKLSEVQLRRLYTLLRDWRGDFDKRDPTSSARRRYAFWTASSVLSKELRSIFLPCLSIVWNDALIELELAASRLAKPLVESSGSKKRRLATEDVESLDKESLRTLQPLLGCLEQSLRADALAGGNWVRADENQRYHALLEPLGQLLQCRMPPNSPISFNNLVLGNGDNDTTTGNVLGCLTALAAAAGNEQLWKPLNYIVVDACGNESRNEVRKAGIQCLLQLMQALGEEYMVLLPECLPVLSELLEDVDEEIVRQAKDCMTLAEELIGESLEESLR